VPVRSNGRQGATREATRKDFREREKPGRDAWPSTLAAKVLRVAECDVADLPSARHEEGSESCRHRVAIRRYRVRSALRSFISPSLFASRIADQIARSNRAHE
jgi:hypothetical protein